MKEKLKPYFRKIKWNWALFGSSFLWLGILAIIADQASKWAVQLSLDYNDPVAIIPNFFYITLTNNTGAAWSIGGGHIAGRIIFIIISVVMSFAFYLYWRRNVETESKLMNATLMLIFGGAVGNLIDRAFYFWEQGSGLPYGVIDWIQFYFGGGPSAPDNRFLNPFPTFNIADACLVVGIIILVIVMIVRGIKESKKEDERFAAKIAKEKAAENNEEKPDGKAD